MAELLTAAQMRALETAWIESGAATGEELMERAGRGVVEAVFDTWPDLAAAPHRAAVMCGPGNNGGDGFVVARLLRGWGWEVEVFLFGDPDRLPPDARANRDRWRDGGGAVAVWTSGAAFAPADDAALLVDALFGTGLGRPADGFDAFARATRSGRARVVAVDIPSGLCSDSGRYLHRADAPAEPRIRADLTVSFHSEKPGHRLAEGPAACGRVVVKDIGLRGNIEGAVRLAGPQAGRAAAAKAGGHKYAHGHALVLSGGAGRTGAARLAARAALRIGAGLVTLGVPGAAQQEVAGQIAALMLHRVDDAEGLEGLLEDDRLNALCLGPGLGIGRARELVPVAFAAIRPGVRAGASAAEVPGQARDAHRALVLDADALTAFEQEPGVLFDLLHPRCVLTPHDREFARLFPDIAGRLNAAPAAGPAFSRVDATREAARRAGCVVLLKGPDTAVAAPDGRAVVNSAGYERAVPWLATAGAGDVLAGFIAGLLARGFAPMAAAESAAWLHVECARRFGPGLIAEDLPETLPAVLRGLGA